jgi:N-methylhydantoinase B
MSERALSAADIETLRLQAEGIAERMQDSLMRAAFSSIAREGMDCAAALFLADGKVIAQARSLPLLLGCLVPAVRGILDRYSAERMAAGDAYILNDPWSGGTHLPDIAMLKPVFAGGKAVALSATILHHQDVGGISPGSVPPDATDIWQEGVRIPPMRWRAGGELDRALARLLQANSRTPEHLMGDLESQWSAVSRGERELAEVIARLGAARFEQAAEALMRQSERLTRAALQSAADGDYHAADALDTDGAGSGPVPIRVALRKRGGSLEIDLTGSAAQTRGPVNAAPSALLAAAFYFMRTLAPDAPSNQGCMAPARVVLPEGSVVNPRPGAALNARTATVKLACNAMLAAWAQAEPEGAPAPNSSVVVVLSVGGVDATGKAFFFTEIIAGGAGAARQADGTPGVSTDVGNGRNLPVEMLEATAPILVERYAVRTGSGGEGARRGGDGVRRVYRLLEGRATVSYRSERHASRAPGASGGGAGASSQAYLYRSNGETETLGSKARFEWQAGERLVIETAGGGGWGPRNLFLS